jgi:hypothetical protein
MIPAMSGRHPKAMIQADKRADPVIEDALDKGYLDTDAAYDVPGLASHAIANDARLSVTRAARRANLSPAAWVADEAGNPCYKGCPAPDSPHMVRFKLWSKDKARGHVFQQSGGDPANLRYNPWTAGRNRRYSDSGEPG